MITLRGLLIGVVLHICSTVTEAQVGAQSGVVVSSSFNQNAQVGVAYGPVSFSTSLPDPSNAYKIVRPPVTILTAAFDVETRIDLATGARAIPGGIKVFPNPAGAGASVTVTCNYTAAALQGALLQIVDMQGKVWQQLTTYNPPRRSPCRRQGVFIS